MIIIEREKKDIISMLSDNNELLLWFQRWIDSQRCHCYHCNKDKSSNSFYYLKKSWVYPKGRLPVCKKCINKMYNYYYGKYGNSYKAMNKICQMFDIYFDIRLFKSVIRDECVVGRYLQRLNLRQNKYKLLRGYDASYLKYENN